MNSENRMSLAGVRGGIAVGLLALTMGNERVYAATAAALVDVRVLLTMSINTLRGLSFGEASSSATPGTITVQPDSTVVASGGVTVGNSNAGAATFQLSGQPNMAFTVTLPTAVQLIEPNGNTMMVNGFQSQPSGAGQLDGNGAVALNVGGTLEVGAMQQPGSYTGLMDVSVSYN